MIIAAGSNPVTKYDASTILKSLKAMNFSSSVDVQTSAIFPSGIAFWLDRAGPPPPISMSFFESPCLLRKSSINNRTRPKEADRSTCTWSWSYRPNKVAGRRLQCLRWPHALEQQRNTTCRFHARTNCRLTHAREITAHPSRTPELLRGRTVRYVYNVDWMSEIDSSHMQQRIVSRHTTSTGVEVERRDLVQRRLIRREARVQNV